MKKVNTNEMWQSLRFSYHIMKNVEAVYFHGEMGTKQDIQNVLFELVAKKYEFSEDSLQLNELINNKVNQFYGKYLQTSQDTEKIGVKAYWKGYTDLLGINASNEDEMLLYVLNPVHPIRKAVTDERIMEVYPVSFIDYQTSGALIILTDDTPNEMLKKLDK